MVVLSSYATWSKWSIYWDADSSLARPRQSYLKPREGRIHDDIAGEEAELDEEQMNRLHSHCPHIFGRIIADEAQKLKTPATVTHRSGYDLQAPSHLLLTKQKVITDLFHQDPGSWKDPGTTLGSRCRAWHCRSLVGSDSAVSLPYNLTTINWQKNCIVVVFVDVPSNAQSLQQATGADDKDRKTACLIYIHSYDQIMWTTAANKMIGIIATYTGHVVTENNTRVGASAKDPTEKRCVAKPWSSLADGLPSNCRWQIPISRDIADLIICGPDREHHYLLGEDG